MDHSLSDPPPTRAGHCRRLPVKNNLFPSPSTPQGDAASRGEIEIAISKSPVYDTLVVREDVSVWLKALAPKSEIDLEKMTFGSVPVDGTLAVEGLSPDGTTMFVVTCGFVTVNYAAKSRRRTGIRLRPQSPGGPSKTPTSGVSQNLHRPRSLRFQSVKLYQSRQIRRRLHPWQ